MESYYQPIQKQASMKIAIQGVQGAFHEIAARSFHIEGGVEIEPADTFDELIRKVVSGETNAAVMAIENTIAGSLLRNYNLLYNNDLKIRGEVFLRIKQNLMAMPGVLLEDLKEVHSHPIALQQCEDFFEAYPHIHLVEAHDTAAVAKEIRQKKLRRIGAVGSELAAQMYQLNIIASGIETYKKNFTRFLYLTRLDTPSPLSAQGFNKVSLVFTTNHTVGSLHKALEVMANNNCNLTKIQSAPIMDKPWEYMFFVDFTLNAYSNYETALRQLHQVTGHIKVLGEYISGEYFE